MFVDIPKTEEAIVSKVGVAATTLAGMTVAIKEQ
jgi:hypothetical protein